MAKMTFRHRAEWTFRWGGSDDAQADRQDRSHSAGGSRKSLPLLRRT